MSVLLWFSSTSFSHSITIYSTYPSFIFDATIAIPITFAAIDCYHTGALIGTKPRTSHLLRKATIVFSLVFAKQARKVSRGGTTVAEIGAFFAGILDTKGSMFTSMAVGAGSEQVSHFCIYTVCVWRVEGVVDVDRVYKKEAPVLTMIWIDGAPFLLLLYIVVACYLLRKSHTHVQRVCPFSCRRAAP
jgi:hypothetical protein